MVGTTTVSFSSKRMRRQSSRDQSARLHLARCGVAPKILLLIVHFFSSILLFQWSPVASFSASGRASNRFTTPIQMIRAGRGRNFGNETFVSLSAAEIPPDVQRPIPCMPSQLFRELAQSQLELLANSLVLTDQQQFTERRANPSTSKVKSMALYLPQENQNTGQLEFVPAVLYPHPDSDRVFIAPEANSRGLTLPNVLSKLPGFAHASTLIPGYPMVSGSSRDVGIGVVEEVFCDIQDKFGAAALSVPLFAGPLTVGVLLVSPDVAMATPRDPVGFWTDSDRQKVGKAAEILSLALSMDNERVQLAQRNRIVQEALSDSLHQLKNPVQALRTYGKLLQQQIAGGLEGDGGHRGGRNTMQLVELVNHLMVQSDRVVKRLGPVDSIVEALGSDERPVFVLAPARTATRAPSSSLVPFSPSFVSKSNMPVGDLYGGTHSTGTALNERSQGESILTLLDDFHVELGFVDEILTETVSVFQAMGMEQGIRFTIVTADELPGVTISVEAVQEIVSNLLDNAFKYVVLPKRGSAFARNPSPQVRIRLLANKAPFPAGVTILVEDNGPGIPPSDHQKVFERGFRGSDTKERLDGSGIGLDIVWTLVQKMGGSVRVLPQGNRQYGPILDGAVMELVLFRSPPN